jgi:SNF2 family DNA or RNA helicase
MILTPAGRLRWETVPDATDAGRVPAAAFESDWREGLFLLAARKTDAPEMPEIQYWRDFASRYLTRLCHVPENAESLEIPPLSRADCAGFVLSAPPMAGGEYLSESVLFDIWEALGEWVRGQIKAAGGLSAFLAARAPSWRQVGRVCFHLAENKNDAAHPFAFMATYTPGFSATGKVRHLPLRNALEQYASEKNRPVLIRLLTPVHQAGESCAWVKEMVDSGAIYQPKAWSASQAYEFLRSVPQLEESGLWVRVPDWWRKRSRPRVSVTIGEKKKSTLGVSALLDFDVRVALGDAAVSMKEVRELLAGEDGLVFFKGQWVEVDRERLREAIEHWQSLEREAEDGQISFIEGMRLLAGASPDLKHEEAVCEEREWVDITAGEGLRDLLAGLRDPAHRARVNPGKALRGTLRPYQQEGVGWLHFLTELGLGACLADDMGLGKTIQVIALLLSLRKQKKERSGPSLLVVPASLLANWRQEAARFAPGLKLLMLHPSETGREEMAAIAKAAAEKLAQTDLAVTTYSMLHRQAWLMEQHWHLVILDEAQAIKNPSTRQSRAVKKVSAHARIALTGTPVENRLGDLWSLFDFLNPGLLGSATVFKQFVKRLQDRHQDQFAPLRKLVSPYILRRMKTDRSIVTDLPEKTETTRYCALTKAQARLYEQTVRNMQAALENAEGMNRRGLVLQTLLRLKQICNHPDQLTGEGAWAGDKSGKFIRIAGLCEELAERQEKVLVFTQFREIIEPLAGHLAAIFGRPGVVLHGGTSVKKRKDIVARFQEEDGPPFFILSLKAGGTGLNLTAASHVIHFDRWWNPAVENQATDRAFRIGQQRNVLVHKFVTRGTVEERIDALIEEKRELADGILGADNEVNLTEMPDEELLDLVRLDINRATL